MTIEITAEAQTSVEKLKTLMTGIRSQAVPLRAEAAASFRRNASAIAQVASGGTVDESEWEEIESEAARINRLAHRLRAILALQVKLLEMLEQPGPAQPAGGGVAMIPTPI